MLKTTTAARGGSNQTGTNAAQSQSPAQAYGAQPITAGHLKRVNVEEYEGDGGKAAHRWTQIGDALPH